ncbi:hypothetical protein L210DRAFT_3475070 [Boletus edulis BED1]|uniref:Autophagy-related protein 14 n=1 Tax=Boletus edulis BED1 TaxID=1328754 RepID=A0AAD4C291_BOLED|nr:hypothetical protein L210DRAFT_3475070 [Boletus edulis BED1]
MSGGAQDALPTPSSTSFDPDVKQGYSEGCFQRRLRHLTSVQIRNLTPFPVRDAFASALSQPATRSQFTPLGNLSDDLDVTLLRRRSRRISTASVNTLKNVAVEDVSDEMRGSGEGRGRWRAQSRAGFPGVGSGGPTSGRNALSLSLAATAARQSRIRTTSTVSSHGLSTSFSCAATASSVSNTPVSTLYFDHSQRTLERVVRSRLVETFITIYVPEPPPLSPSPPTVNGKSRSRADSGPSPSPAKSATVSNTSVRAARNETRTSKSTSIGTAKTLSVPAASHVTSRRLSVPRGKSQSMARQVSSSSSGVKTHRASSSAPLQKSSSHQSPLPPSAEAFVFPKVPNYISPIHRPSTNPLYSLDASCQSDFAEHTNLSADRLKIQLLAKVDLNAMHPGNAKGKQKDTGDTGGTSGNPQWKVLEEWDFSLSDLIPLSPELENHPSQLPSNALVMSFLPTGQSFHLPAPAWSRSRSQSRSPSPSGYNTDPESEGRKLVQVTQAIPSISHEIIQSSQALLSVPRRSRKLEARTANLEELSQLVTLQVCIRDTEESLHDVIREIDLCLAKDHAVMLKREASGRQARIEDRRAETQAIIEGSNHLRDDLAMRRMQIQTRRDCLAKAKALQVQETSRLSGQVTEITEERSNLITVRNCLPAIRTSLISTLATIYPIELLSASELLFTILAVPLPIPFNSNEPAPPLSLSSHKEVTEESVATALGYAAHLVQLLSVYMGRCLVYPITYIGSRSLIRDNISAMVGPRMFPLFSKGVDTYRFEYAVFLLNKDIEMLMADRDLRALDMRHTLPNLKNLLLTLTDGECASVHNSRYEDSPSTVGLTTPPRATSLPATHQAPETPKAGRSPRVSTAELSQEPDASPSSGATTPKAGQGEGGTSTISRYSKLSLAFPPLPVFFRSRNSPTILQSSAKSATDTVEEARDSVAFVGVSPSSSEGTESGHAGRAEDDDDRRTIKGVIVDAAEPDGNGEARDGATSAAEKIVDATSLTVVAVDSFV